MGRQPCCDKVGLKRGPWTIDEDQKLISFILNNGIHCWRTVPKLAGLLRCGKSCRLRWINYLRPDLKRGDFSEDEENQLIQLHSRLGNKWSKIASHFPGRTDNEIKNHWNTRIKKRLSLVGVEEERSSLTESSKAIEEIGRGETKGTEKEHDDEFESIILDELPSSNDLYNVLLSGNSNFSTTMTQSGSFSSNNNYSASVSEDINSQYDLQQQWPLETTVDSYGWENLDSYLGHDEFFYFQNL